MTYYELGIIGRFQPPTIGHESLLRAASVSAVRLRIGIGSANRHDADRPYFPDEIADMLALLLDPLDVPYRILQIPDYGHLPGCEDGSRWREHMRTAFGGVSALVSGNPYVERLLSPHITILSPWEIVVAGQQRIASATLVRERIARGERWEPLVPAPVTAYLKDHGLDERLRREFGAQITNDASGIASLHPSLDTEIRKVCGGSP